MPFLFKMILHKVLTNISHVSYQWITLKGQQPNLFFQSFEIMLSCQWRTLKENQTKLLGNLAANGLEKKTFSRRISWPR